MREQETVTQFVILEDAEQGDDPLFDFHSYVVARVGEVLYYEVERNLDPLVWADYHIEHVNRLKGRRFRVVRVEHLLETRNAITRPFLHYVNLYVVELDRNGLLK